MDRDGKQRDPGQRNVRRQRQPERHADTDRRQLKLRVQRDAAQSGNPVWQPTVQEAVYGGQLSEVQSGAIVPVTGGATLNKLATAQIWNTEQPS